MKKTEIKTTITKLILVLIELRNTFPATTVSKGWSPRGGTRFVDFVKTRFPSVRPIIAVIDMHGLPRASVAALIHSESKPAFSRLFRDGRSTPGLGWGGDLVLPWQEEEYLPTGSQGPSRPCTVLRTPAARPVHTPPILERSQNPFPCSGRQ